MFSGFFFVARRFCYCYCRINLNSTQFFCCSNRVLFLEAAANGMLSGTNKQIMSIRVYDIQIESVISNIHTHTHTANEMVFTLNLNRSNWRNACAMCM